MSRVLVLASKEFKSYFNSWLAYVFIACFVTVSMLAHFYWGEFFGTGRADISPFFRSLPLTLLILVPGLTMRQWARESEMGSIELLMTLPAQGWQLVLGKFLGTLGLVAVALLCTAGIPLTAAWLGDLDWGPVLAGYLAALLLGGAYVALGLFASSWFREQFLALIGSAALCSLFGLMSWPKVLGWASNISETAVSVLGFVGFYGRFEAIQRGVIDFRDVAWYLSITALFLFFNVCRLHLRRLA
ncbi:MAG TPA: hypothetical protein ENK43_07725 [Planctomycetes bacterium]|nr:hypothetical protein [Planctomycetota bacterium]